MRRTSFEDMACSIAQCLEVVGEWWTMLIIRDAFFGVSRFDEFQHRLGISRDVLSQRLEHLVEHAILERVGYCEQPVRYDYRLTDKGRDLWLVLTTMQQWGDRWAAPAGPPVQAVHRGCGHAMTIMPTCSACGQLVELADVRMAPGPGARDTPALPLLPTAS